ncbi:MAG: tRNA lysidine(34) synthetase TilS [Clostridia bacterium]|nr:tRNA lysidine(34) synthetase TilS [Clostridia bacterium]
MKLFDAEQYRGMKVCIALSGGLDSVCLLHAFHSIAHAYDIALLALHVEHGIRGEESLRDLTFCEALCRDWQIPLFVERANVPALSLEYSQGIEETARRVRYAAFEKIIAEGRADVVATAHHLNDVAETVLFRLARGTSAAGMRAITQREGIVRPLLATSREELTKYAEENGLYHVEDSTNENEAYARNKIRRTVIPALESISDRASLHIARFAALTAADDAYLQELAASRIVQKNGEACVPVELPEPLFLRACLACMKALGAQRDYTGANLEEVARLRSLQSGKKASLPNGVEAIRDREHIVFYGCDSVSEKEAPFIGEGVYSVGSFAFSVSSKEENGALRVDLDAFPEGCVVRARREGDVFTPYRAPNKTLKKFLSDRKIAARLGRKLPLIANGSEVLAVIGVEISDKVKVTNSTARVGYIHNNF